MENCAVVAFYGIQFNSAALKNWYEDIVMWFGERGRPVERMAVGGEGFSGKVGSFSRNNSKLIKNGFCDIYHLSLYSLEPGGEIPLWHWVITSDVDEYNSYCLAGVRTSISDLIDGPMEKIAFRMADVFKPRYGIGFRRPLREGPSAYVIGLPQGLAVEGKERQIGERIQKWYKVGILDRIYEKGILRDVYPWNFLSPVHLSKSIERTSLEKWILSSSRRGSLSIFNSDLKLWTLADDEIVELRPKLQRAGLLFDSVP